MEKLTKSSYKHIIDEWESDKDKDNDQEKHRSCNISATQEFVDRIDFLLEAGYVNYNTRSEFLRNIILEKIVEIEVENNISNSNSELKGMVSNEYG